MKHCCKNLVILMPEPVAEPALNGLRLNLRIVSIVMFNFASYLTIGLPLAVLPGYVHDVMGFSAFWAGLVISLQYFATLLSRPHAGRYAIRWDPKRLSSSVYAAAFERSGVSDSQVTASLPVISLLLLCLGRVILGIGQSFAGTGSTLWGVGVVGSLHIGRVISWNGIVTYGAMAMGAPLGVVFYHWGGLQALALIIMGVALVAILLAIPRPTVKASKGKPLPFRAVLGRVWLYGMALALASAGFWRHRHLYHAVL
ncbi:MFS transporter [Escherichia coli]